MKLIDVETLELVEFPTRPPAPYAILSHTWCTNNADEVQYDDIRTQGINGCPDKPGKFKVEGCCRQAKADGHNYVWIDSCCINKDSAVELGMAINSMYRWYREAAVCYVYMADVPADEGVLDEGGAFSQSRWFKRGWTLQEMLAPPDLHFFNQDWHAIAKKEDIVNDLETITSIPRQYLFDFDPATTTASAAQRMSWAAHRITTREEDCAYCLLGLFDVNLVMIYGEGGRKAFIRLQQAIMEKTGDNSVLAWGSRGQMTSAATNMVPVTMPQAVSVPGGDNSKKSEGIWASEPRDFAHCGNIVTRPVSFAGGCTFASGRMRVDMDLCVAKTDTVPSPSPSAEGVSTGSPRPASSPPFQLRGNTVVYGLLNCGTGRSPDQLTVAIPLALVSSSGGSRDSFVVEYIRPKGFSPILVARDAAVDPGNSHPGIHIRMERDAQGDSQGGRQKLWVGFHYPRQHLALAETYPKAAWRGSTMLMTPTDEIADFGQHNANWYLARLSLVRKPGSGPAEKDVVAIVCEKTHTFTSCLMLVSQNTQLADLADFVRDMPPLIYKEHVVEVGGIAVELAYERHAEFSLKLTRRPIGAKSPLDAEREMAHVANMRKISDLLRKEQELEKLVSESDAESTAKNDSLGIAARRLLAIDAALEELQAEKSALKKTMSLLTQEAQSAIHRHSNAMMLHRQVLNDLDHTKKAADARDIVSGPGNWLARAMHTTCYGSESCDTCKSNLLATVLNSNANASDNCSGSECQIAGEALAVNNSDGVCTSINVGRLVVFDGVYDAATTTGQEALFIHVCHGELRKARWILERGANANGLLKHQIRPLLSIAVSQGDTKMAEMLIGHGAFIDGVYSFNGHTPLWQALYSGHHSAAKVLLDKGADINALSRTQCSPLYLSVAERKPKAVRFLFENGATVEEDCVQDMLQLAIKNKSSDLLDLLLSHEKFQGNDIFCAALTKAVESGNSGLVRIVLSSKHKGAVDLAIVMGHAKTAARRGKLEILKLLLAPLPREKLSDRKVTVDLLYNAVRGSSLQVVEYLLDRGCPLDADALVWAAEKDNVWTMQYLLGLENGSSWSINMALYRAVKAGSAKAALFLLQRGANPNYKPGFKDTALKRAKKMGNSEMLAILQASHTVAPKEALQSPVSTPGSS